jgi:hypothetical protein
LPTFQLCTFRMHKTVIHQIDKYRKHCFWRKHYKKPCDPWRYSHDVFRFCHRSHCIRDELSDFIIDSQYWIWSPIWSPNSMTLCQFRHRFRHRSRYIHDNIQNSS